MGININILSNFNGSGFDKLGKELKRLDTPMEKLGATTKALAPAAAIGLTALVAMGGSAIKAAESAQVADDRLSNIVNSMGLFGSETDTVTKRLQDFATATMEQTAVDDEVIKSTQAKLLTFKNLALTADETGGAMDRATVAALDLAAAGFGSAETNAVQLGKALQDPVKGITALGRAGVTFTESEKEKIASLVESGQLLEAQNMVLSAIETQVGGTAEATATGSALMNTAFGEMQESIGAALLPLFEQLVPIVTGFFDWIGANSGVVTALAAIFGTLAIAILAVNFAMNANPIVLIITGVALLIAGVILLVNWIVQLFGGWDKLFKALGKWLSDIGKFFGTIWNGIVNIVKGVIKVIGDIWNGWVSGVQTALKNIGDFFRTIFDAIGGFFKRIVNGWIGIFESFINFFVNGINGIIDGLNFVLKGIKAATGGVIDLQVGKIPTVKLPRLAEGGIVMPRPGGVLANIAEAGQAEAVIPLDRLGDFTGGGRGATYNVTVNAGLGADGNKIGQAIVDQILKFERSSGQVFARA